MGQARPVPSATTIREVAAKKTGVDRLIEVSPELGQLILDAPDRLTKALLHRRARSLGGLANTALTPAPADGSRELAGEKVDLRACLLCACRVGEGLGFAELLAKLEQAAAVFLHRFSIERRARVAELVGFVSGRQELEDVKLLSSGLHESREDQQTSAFAHAACGPATRRTRSHPRGEARISLGLELPRARGMDRCQRRARQGAAGGPSDPARLPEHVPAR
jgi:hypothetical protein